MAWKREGAMLEAIRLLYSWEYWELKMPFSQGPAGPRYHAAVLTVLLRTLLHAQRAHFDLLEGAQRAPRVHQADSRRAEETVGAAQGGRAEPARSGKSSTDGQGGGGTLGLRRN